MKKIIIYLSLLLIVDTALAQKGSVKGRVVDGKDKVFVPGATVSIQKMPDSVLVGFTMSDEQGLFEYKGLQEGSYKIIIKMIGSDILKKDFQISAQKLDIHLGNLELQPESIEGIVVKGEVAPVEIKEDTVEFNAKAFKTKPNATTEDLLKKLPGVEVARDGSVKAQGEQVKKVLVDGKPFFGDDPKMATKNIPADMIEKVQVIDQLSEQSQFSGVDDGNRDKVINITTKKNMKKGTFGRAIAGAGTNERYEGNLSLNRFNDDQQLSLIASANNINQQNFTLGNSFNLQNGGNTRVSGGTLQRIANAFGTSNTNNNTGITTIWSAGLNFNDDIGKKWKVNGNYFFNNSELAVKQTTNQQNILADSTFFIFQNNENTTKTDNHRLNMRIDYQIDTFKTLRIIPVVSVTQSKYDNFSVSTTRSNENALLNTGNTNNLSDNLQLNYNNTFLYRQRFAKRGRTFAANFTLTGSSQDSKDKNDALNDFYAADTLASSRNIRQQTKQNTNNLTLSGGLSYTEPLNRKHSIEMNYQVSNNKNISDRQVADFDEVEQDYTLPNTLLSNNFDNHYYSHRGGLNFITNKLKYNFTIGVAAQYAVQDNIDLSQNNAPFKREFFNVFPNAQLRYNFGKNRRLRIDYRGSTQQPTATQLQPVKDNSNPLNITEGNPDLKQEVNNTIHINFVSFNMNKFSSFFAFASVSNTANKIVNTTNISSFGTQINSYKNADGIWNAVAFAGMGFPLKGNSITLGLTSNFLWNSNKSFINNAENISQTYTLGQGVRFVWNYKEALDLNLLGNLNYSVAEYSLQPQNNNYYFTTSFMADITYTFPWGIVLGTELDYFANSGLAEGFNQNYTIWNVSVAKQLFKDKRGELKLRVYDALEQNVGISRNTTETYIQDVSNVVLQKYFMLTFTYNINRFAAQRQEERRMERMMR
ncbi:MAG: outer membrane beta-barrel protein [Thermonemataceae bacterium]|nr:outer membrane beta-barrel protein [Thermonemataceae bacterium]